MRSSAQPFLNVLDNAIQKNFRQRREALAVRGLEFRIAADVGPLARVDCSDAVEHPFAVAG